MKFMIHRQSNVIFKTRLFRVSSCKGMTYNLHRVSECWQKKHLYTGFHADDPESADNNEVVTNAVWPLNMRSPQFSSIPYMAPVRPTASHMLSRACKWKPNIPTH